MTYVIGLLLLSIEVYLAAHAYRTGREIWIFLILFVPIAGALVYLIVAWIPDMDRQLQGDSYSVEHPDDWSSPRKSPIGLSQLTAGGNAALEDPDDPAKKLRLLRQMLEADLISETDYETKKAEILSDM